MSALPVSTPSRCIARIPTSCRERFLTSTEPGRSLLAAAGIEYAGLSDLRRPYEMQRWSSPHHVVLFTVAGRGRLMIEGSATDLTAGSVCVLPAVVDHRYHACGSWRIVWFHPATDESWNKLLGTKATVQRQRHGARIVELARWIDAESGRSDSAARESVRLSFDLMLQLLKRELHSEDPPGDGAWRLKIDRLWDQVRADPARWKIDALATAAGCSRTHFHALCRRLYSRSPQDRLLEIRMRRALDYLRHTPWSLEQISALLGYADAFAFSKAFRRETGQSPAHYRAQCRR